MKECWIGVLAVWAVGASAAEAFAEAEVRGLKPGGSTLVRDGLERLSTSLAVRVAEAAQSSDAMSRALEEELKAEPGLLAAYPRGEAGPRALFVSARGLSEQGKVLVKWLERARFHAVEVAVPGSVGELAADVAPLPTGLVVEAWASTRGAEDRLAAIVRELGLRAGGSSDGAKLAAVERDLGRALATMARAWKARVRASAVHADESGRYLSPDTLWKADAADEAAVGEAFAAATGGELERWFERNMPGHPQYRALVGATERYAARCAAGGFTGVSWTVTRGAMVKPEKAKPEELLGLQARLKDEGFLDGEPTAVWDAATQAAVAEVRRVRHLKEKGDVDKALLDALNVSCEERLRTLVLNVRRWRFTAWNGEIERVEVNLAGQVVRYLRDGALVMKQRTVVGSDKSFFSKSEQRRVWPNASPILHDSISMVIVNPEWNVPPRIAREEIEPEIAKDPEYVSKKRFRVIETAGGRMFVQEPGPGNALGLVKILFPNSESVYLHDTPGKAAFKLPVRALSHGCVRVENAMDFAAELVRADKAKSGENFDPARLKWLTQTSAKSWPFRIEKPIPVFLEYYTASVDEDGAVWFHPDIYGYDAEALK